jgi:hypothetical protein
MSAGVSRAVAPRPDPASPATHEAWVGDERCSSGRPRIAEAASTSPRQQQRDRACAATIALTVPGAAVLPRHQPHGWIVRSPTGVSDERGCAESSAGTVRTLVRFPRGCPSSACADRSGGMDLMCQSPPNCSCSTTSRHHHGRRVQARHSVYSPAATGRLLDQALARYSTGGRPSTTTGIPAHHWIVMSGDHVPAASRLR